MSGNNELDAGFMRLKAAIERRQHRKKVMIITIALAIGIAVIIVLNVLG